MNYKIKHQSPSCLVFYLTFRKPNQSRQTTFAIRNVFYAEVYIQREGPVGVQCPPPHGQIPGYAPDFMHIYKMDLF